MVKVKKGMRFFDRQGLMYEITTVRRDKIHFIYKCFNDPTHDNGKTLQHHGQLGLIEVLEDHLRKGNVFFDTPAGRALFFKEKEPIKIDGIEIEDGDKVLIKDYGF